MPVQTSYDTEAAQPHLPAQARGKPSSCTPSPTLSVSVCPSPLLFSPGLAYIVLYTPFLKAGNLCFIYCYTLWWASLNTETVLSPAVVVTQLCGPSTLWSLNFETALLLAGNLCGRKPLWQSYHSIFTRITFGSKRASNWIILKHSDVLQTLQWSSYRIYIYLNIPHES